MKVWTRKEVRQFKTLEDFYEEVKSGHTSNDTRKEHWLKYLPAGGKHREIGGHQGLNIARCLIDYDASYVDAYDIRKDYYNVVSHLFGDYCNRTGKKVHFKVTQGGPELYGKVKEVDTCWIDASKNGDFVYHSLIANSAKTKVAMGVDDLVSSPDICRGVDMFNRTHGHEWKLEYEDRDVYPGVAVFVRR